MAKKVGGQAGPSSELFSLNRGSHGEVTGGSVRGTAGLPVRSGAHATGPSLGVCPRCPAVRVTPASGARVVWQCASAPAGRRRAPEEEDGAEQQPGPRARRAREGGGPQHPAARAGGPVLHRRGHHREDRLVEAAGGGGPGERGARHVLGFKFTITVYKKKLMYDDISQVLPLNYPSLRVRVHTHTNVT